MNKPINVFILLWLIHVLHLLAIFWLPASIMNSKYLNLFEGNAKILLPGVYSSVLCCLWWLDDYQLQAIHMNWQINCCSLERSQIHRLYDDDVCVTTTWGGCFEAWRVRSVRVMQSVVQRLPLALVNAVNKQHDWSKLTSEVLSLPRTLSVSPSVVAVRITTISLQVHCLLIFCFV